MWLTVNGGAAALGDRQRWHCLALLGRFSIASRVAVIGLWYDSILGNFKNYSLVNVYFCIIYVFKICLEHESFFLILLISQSVKM